MLFVGQFAAHVLGIEDATEQAEAVISAARRLLRESTPPVAVREVCAAGLWCW